MHECHTFAEEIKNGEVVILDEHGNNDLEPVHEIDKNNFLKATEEVVFHPSLYVDEIYEEADRVFGVMKANVLGKYIKWAWHKEIQSTYLMCVCFLLLPCLIVMDNHIN